MKRMIDYKEYEELQELAQGAQSDIDRLAGVYTYATLEISDSDFEGIDPLNPSQFSPVSLAVSDIIYIDGEEADLTAEKCAELWDANIIVLSDGENPAAYQTIIFQRSYIDTANDFQPYERAARFEAFVTLNSTIYHYTMNVTRYDETSAPGGGIVIACSPVVPQIETGTKLYKHTIKDGNNLLCIIISPKSSAHTFFRASNGHIVINGGNTEGAKMVNIKCFSNGYYYSGFFKTLYTYEIGDIEIAYVNASNEIVFPINAASSVSTLSDTVEAL